MLLIKETSHLSSGLSWIGRKAKANPVNPITAAMGIEIIEGKGADLKKRYPVTAPAAR